jgi:8-oxo-dGTP diphosphatase
VAIAILYQNNSFLMQLRDENPEIAHPGCWAFFGGHLEPEEPPGIAIQRELLEEIGYTPPHLKLFRTSEDSNLIRYVFQAPLTVALNTLELNEGCDLGLVTIEEIRQGSCYSHRMQRSYPLGAPHQQILLEFIQQKLHP